MQHRALFLFKALFLETIFYNILCPLLPPPTCFDFTGNHSVCLLQRGTQDNKGKSQVLFTVDKSSVWLCTQWCAEVARQRGRLVEQTDSLCALNEHTHLELLNLISAVLFVLLCTLKWWADWLRSAPPMHHKGQTDETQACYGPINLMLPPLIMTVLYCVLTVLNYWLHTCPAYSQLCNYSIQTKNMERSTIKSGKTNDNL